MKPETLDIFLFVYIIVVVTPLSISTIYAFYLVIKNNIELYSYRKNIKEIKIKILKKIDLQLSKKSEFNEDDLREFKEQIKRY